jgi:4-amino-4-deoxy-L-arabinose transferase-like glycosyltransferase
VVLAAAAAAVWLCYLAARELGLSRALAASGAVMLAAFPVFIFTSIQPLSDTPATAWGLAALYAALRARRDPRWALAAGAALAMAVLVRPTNLLLTPALLVLLGADGRRLGLFVLGGLPGAGWLAWYNHQLYGHALRSGYGDIFAAFGWVHGAPTAGHFARWLALLLPSAVLILPWAVLLRRESRSRVALALAVLFAAITGCYLFYEVSHEVWWCLRFILPAVPALILGALLGVEALARGPAQRWAHPFRRVAATALALWAVGLSLYWVPNLAVLMMKKYEQVYADATQEALSRLPRHALVVSSAFSGSLYYYTDFAVLRTDQVEATDFNRYASLARAAGHPICAVLFDSEEAEAFRRCPGAWTRLTQFRNVGLWQLTASSPN